MKVLISGGTGLVGKALVDRLVRNGHSVHILSRNPSRPNEFRWHVNNGEIDHAAFERIDAIVHLAGASIGKRWTKNYRAELYNSRIRGAELLLKTAENLHLNLKAFITASGSNYYGTYTSNEMLTEEMPVQHKDFLSELSTAWEKTADDFAETAERIVKVRTGVVLARKGGTLPLLKKLVKLNIGSPVGTGAQWMNWIHLDDLVSIYLHALENPSVNGPINAVALPETNSAFMKTLAESENRLFLNVPVPGFILKTVLGEMSTLLLEGTRLSNKKIKDHGFTFRFEKLYTALEDLR